MEEARKVITTMAKEKEKLVNMIATDIEKSQKILGYLVKLQTVVPQAINATVVSELQGYVKECETVYNEWKKDLVGLSKIIEQIKAEMPVDVSKEEKPEVAEVAAVPKAPPVKKGLLRRVKK